MEKQKVKHDKYIKIIWNISLFIGSIWAILEWLTKLYNEAQQGNVFGFIFFLILQSALMCLYALFYASIIFGIAITLTIIPFMIYRGLLNN